ncbi:Wobble nucleotide-excising tRNase [Kaistia soli DSM 19436]|uniref:Wobble nucleotide-excising tRNase n=1 Tax=Kaistia soli DSM 19436 TaxID=1122133 RepID=A0A1M5IWL9_9HYPH|nr:AAA family ATPase [Kaistia soli]SHG32727.1 Wobble nucleotide-excising tRNase [Kaistia soli DSM 19436]
MAAQTGLKLSVRALGPVTKLEASLSQNAQNLIYARNGTGKSFLTRALRYIDLFGQGQDISDAAFNLVSEEASDSEGSFLLTRGDSRVASLSLNLRAAQVKADAHGRIFHVFSDEFVNSELRQRQFEIDGNIETEIILDHQLIDTKALEKRRSAKESQISEAWTTLQRSMNAQRDSELVDRAKVNRRLREFLDVTIARCVDHAQQPALPDRSLKTIIGDLDSLKALPSDPDHPSKIGDISFRTEDTHKIAELLAKITSPSTISDEIKQHLAQAPEFFQVGLEALAAAGDERCPFCRQSVAHPPAKEHIELYLAYFADAEGRHKAELREAWVGIKAVRTAIQALLGDVARATSKYEALRKHIPSQRDAPLPDVIGSAGRLDRVLMQYQEAVEAKGKSPSAAVALPDRSIEQHLGDLHYEVLETNAAFQKLFFAVEASDNERLRLQREACQAFVTEFTHANWLAISAIHIASLELFGIESELADLLKSQLSASAKQRVAQTFEMLISNLFGKKYAFDRENFVLKRESRSMARGAARTLSDGEKTAIAFCYFIACAHKKVRSSSDYLKLFFVFDDPITSMSYDFIFSIAQTLKNISIDGNGMISINPADKSRNGSADLLIFTHSSYFYNICITNGVIRKGSAFFLSKEDGEHKIFPYAKYAAPFEQHLKEVFDVSIGREPDHTTGNSIRSVLEAVGRFCHPDKCGQLSEYVGFLAGEEGVIIKSVLINNLSHGTYYEDTPSPEEIREACGEAIAIVERYAKGQVELIRAASRN